MCDQGKKDRITQNGKFRNGSAPASQEREIFPVDYQNLMCYNDDAGSTGEALTGKESGTCTGGVDLHREALDKLCALSESQLSAFILSVAEAQRQGVLPPFEALPGSTRKSNGPA